MGEPLRVGWMQLGLKCPGCSHVCQIIENPTLIDSDSEKFERMESKESSMGVFIALAFEDVQIYVYHG